MPNFGTIPPGSPQQERAYKRGYLDGVNAALKVFGNNLSEDERLLFGEWATSIADWRAKPERGAFEPPLLPTMR